MQANVGPDSRDLSRFRNGGIAYSYRSAVPGFAEAKIPGLAVRFAVTRVRGRSIYSDKEAEAVRRIFGPRLAKAGFDFLIVHVRIPQTLGVFTETFEYERTKRGQFAKVGSDEPIVTDVVGSHGF